MGATLSSFVRSETPEMFIRRVVSEHCVVVFAKTQCPYSQMAKDIFAMLEVPIKTIDIDLRSDGDSLQDTLKDMTKVRTVSHLSLTYTAVQGRIQDLPRGRTMASL